jgi:hypothetical protein
MTTTSSNASGRTPIGKAGSAGGSDHPDPRSGFNRWLRCRRGGLMLISKGTGKLVNGA